MNESYLQTLQKKQDAKDYKKSIILETVTEQLEDNRSIWKVDQVQKLVLDNFDAKVSSYDVRRVLKEDFDMSYRAIKRVPYHGNSERCKVLRMFYAKEMLQQLHKGVRAINIDETWIPHMDFRSKMWRQRGLNNTHPLKQITFRVNMIAAVDTDGNVYASLTQFNTDSSEAVMIVSFF